ncbi:MAG: hypothetical protein ACRCS6_07025 [Turicibacter sp.]
MKKKIEVIKKVVRALEVNQVDPNSISMDDVSTFIMNGDDVKLFINSSKTGLKLVDEKGNELVIDISKKSDHPYTTEVIVKDHSEEMGEMPSINPEVLNEVSNMLNELIKDPSDLRNKINEIHAKLPEEVRKQIEKDANARMERIKSGHIKPLNKEQFGKMMERMFGPKPEIKDHVIGKIDEDFTHTSDAFDHVTSIDWDSIREFCTDNFENKVIKVEQIDKRAIVTFDNGTVFEFEGTESGKIRIL